ncbi:MAG: virulence factor [Nisaea sp.]|uniref:virulence factor n=1 Tax=Nisaea sp. TaxID=2024842 RepID=UPI001AFF702B|nr:virulence factor [Nisaea sp.]MBO6562502.1 virulence factor [Nisaea sp.]
MAHLITVYWRDIPAQVIAEEGRGRRRSQAKVELPVRFIHAIDMAAMRDGSEDEDAYLAGWRRSDPVECGADLEAEAQGAAEALEAEYDGERLKALIANGGNAAE